MPALTDYLENKIVDWLLRAQVFAPPATLYVGLLTAAPSDATAGTEVAGGSYARVPVTSGLAAWSGTQAAATTVASSGTDGTVENNAAITFPAPTASWGVVTHFAIYDAATAGNMLIWSALTTAKTINSGDAAPSYAAAALTFQIDN